MEKVDFHVHYNNESLENIFSRSKEKDVVAIALIDKVFPNHDTLLINKLENKYGIETILGVELLARVGDSACEVICLNVNPEIKGEDSFWSRKNIENRNKTTVEQQIRYLESNGFRFNPISENDRTLLEEVKQGRVSERAISLCEVIARSPDNDSIIETLKREKSSTLSSINDRFSSSPLYRARQDKLTARFLYELYFSRGTQGQVIGQIDIKTLIEKMHEEQGVVIYSPEGNFDQGIWEEIIKLGIDGIMTWHGARLGEELRGNNLDINLKVIKDQGLLILGGSDYDPRKDEWQVGTGVGNLFISPRRLFEYKEYIKKLKSKTQA